MIKRSAHILFILICQFWSVSFAQNNTAIADSLLNLLKKDKQDTYQFQVVVRLISNVDSQTILTVQNEYPVRTYTADSGGMRPANLDQFRAQILVQMAKDIEKAIAEARK